MRQFRLRQLHAGRLVSYFLSGSTRPTAGKKKVRGERPSSSCGNSEVDALSVSESRFCSQSPGAALRSVQRLWPARYY